jgi:hypothetical protein
MENQKAVPVLSLNSPTFAEDLADSLGIQPGEKIQIMTPQFDRMDGKMVTVPEFTPLDWAKLPTKSHEELIGMGLGVWKKGEEGTHYLFPHEWYNIIPEGLEMKCINGTTEIFKRGVTDDDKRFGCIAYGFVKPASDPV